MGVKGLNSIIERTSASTDVQLKEIKGSIAIDTSIFIHQWVKSMRSKGSDLQTTNGRMTSHIFGFIRDTLKYLSHDIIPIYVLEGKAPELKKHIVDERRDKRNEAIKKLDTNSWDSDEERNKLFIKSYSPSSTEMDDLIRVMNLMGIPVVQSLSEGELQCSALNISGKVQGVFTNDWDSLAFGTKTLYRKIHRNNSTKTSVYQKIELNKVLEDLDLTHEQFVDICILIGTDYNKKPYKMGPIEILRIYKENGKTMNGMINAMIDIPEKHAYGYNNFIENWESAKQFYLRADVYDPSKIDVKWLQPNYNALHDFLVRVLQFDKKRVSKQISQLKKMYADYTTKNRKQSRHRKQVTKKYQRHIYNFTN